MTQTTTQNQIYIVDVTVASGVNFHHRNELASQDYWAVFTKWPISLSHNGSEPMALALGGSWYPMKNENRCPFTCQPYMDERLGAQTIYQKIECIKHLQNAYQKGASLTGTIDSIIPQPRNGNKTALKATIDTLGEIIMIDYVRHPKLPYLINQPQCTIYGRGTYPWAPIAQKAQLLKKYKM